MMEWHQNYRFFAALSNVALSFNIDINNMETISSCNLGEKLIIVLQKLTGSNLKVLDDVFLQKLLCGIKNELSKTTNEITNLEELIKWLISITEYWIDNPPPLNVLAFVMQLIGIFSENEEIFNRIKDPLLHRNLNNLKGHMYKSTNLKLTYIALLSSAANHRSGCCWILNEKLWKEVLDTYLCKSGFFIEREAITVLTKLLENSNWDNSLLEDILRIIILELEFYRNEFQVEQRNEKDAELFYKKLEIVIVSVLQAYIVILETWVISGSAKINSNFLGSADMKLFWKLLLETNDSESLLEKVSIAYILQSICANHDVKNLTQVKGIPDCIFEIFKILVKRDKISNVIKLAKYCQIFWNKITADNSPDQNGDLESHFIIIQMVPAFLLLKRPKQENTILEIYVNKIHDLTSENTLRLGYLIRDVIKYGEKEDSADYAFQAVLSVSKNMETLNLKRAVLIFQGLANLLKIFIPLSCDYDEPMTDEEFQSGQMLCRSKEALLSAILNSICVLIEKFKINWTEALESLCLLKFSATLLNNPNLSPRLCVQTLSLIKLAILNFMAPNLVLLTNKIEGTSFECLIKILYNRFHDPHWEIRDSCVEVIGIMAELADTKYPVFQEILIQGKYCELILSMIDGDSESYVRSSALRALAPMIRIESIRNRYLNDIDLISKISGILRNESEGIVRREAALLAKELFENCRSNSLTSLYHVMGYAAICDLHWEVKVNSLLFWEKVIQRFISDQGMIDGFFPSITFSKDNKKIVSLTNEEIKSRLMKVLNELSNIGCLHLMVTTLKDDYDFQVVQKSAQIWADLLKVLKHYGLLEKQYIGMPQNSNFSIKRKSSDESLPEKKFIHTSGIHKDEESESDKSDRVIEDIVNDQDLNLLGNVYNPSTISPCQGIDNFSLQKITPEVFLNEMKTTNITSLLNAKRKWLLSKEDDLNELINDIFTLSVECDTNILDCY